MSEAGKTTLLLEQGGPSYFSTGGRARPAWLNGTDLSRVDVPGLYKSIFSTQDNLTCPEGLINSFTACTLGGNTAINAGLFFQPPASDFDRYFPPGWKSADMQNAIEKARAKQPSTDVPSADGKMYLQTGYEAAKEWLVGHAGYREVRINQEADDKSKVFGHPVFNYEGGQRSGPAKTYLRSALGRPNFTLLTGARAIRVLRDGETARGVEAIVNGTTTTFSLGPSGRVILSGGALFSPSLLMHSGIGDPEVLANLSDAGLLPLPPSDWINNTAVGDKLFDNPNTFIELASPRIASYEYSYDSPPPADRDLYLSSRSGPYAFASQTSAFWDVVEQGEELVGCQGTVDSSGAIDFTDNHTVTLNVYGTSGLRSTGKVTLDEKGVPGASSGFFYADRRDAEAVGAFLYGIFQKLPAWLTPLNIARNSTLEELVAWVGSKTSYTGGNVLHWSSSCRFDTCVDRDARVLGMENLFVVDASIVMPFTTNPVMGIMIAAERAAERILALD